MEWKTKKPRAKPGPSVDNSAIEVFEQEAATIVAEWNRLHAEQSGGRLLLEIEGGTRNTLPKKFVCWQIQVQNFTQ